MDDFDQATLNDDPAANPQDSATSMDDTIAKAWADIQARDSAPEPQDDPAQAAPAQQRDASGKFTAKPAEGADGKNQSAQAAPATDPAPADPAAQSDPKAANQLPEWMQMGLRKEEAEAVARAPKEAQDAFMRRIKDAQEGVKRLHEQLGGKAQAAEAFEQAIAPFMPTIQRLGIPPQQAVQQLLAAEHGLRYGNEEQRATHALQVLNSYGINLQQLFAIATGQKAPAQQQVAPPQPQQQVPDLSKTVDEAVETRFLQREIAQFKSQPGHEHFEELAPVMGSLMEAGHAKSLEDAYDQALRAHPTYGQEWLAKQLAENETKRKAEAQQRAKEARLAAAPNVSRRGTLPAAKPIGSIEDTIRDEAQRLGLI